MFSSFKVLVLVIFSFSLTNQNTFGAVLVHSNNNQSSPLNSQNQLSSQIYEQSSQKIFEKNDQT